MDDVIDDAAVKRFDEGGLRTPGFMTMLASFEGYLMIYKDTKLAWTTKLQNVPIYVNKSTFQSREGLIVTFSDSGFLQVSYLGTDQMSQTDLGKLHQNEKQVDYVKMDE